MISPRTSPQQLQAQLGNLKLQSARLLEQIAGATDPETRRTLKTKRLAILREREKLKSALAESVRQERRG